MEIITTAIHVAQGVRCLVAAIKGESQLIISARQLMHTCKVYEDCLTTLKDTMERRQRHIKDPKAAQAGMAMICNQVQNDSKLLSDILKEIQAICDSQSKGVLSNVLITAFTGRADKIKRLEADLMYRVQVTTSMMMKDVWSNASGPDKDIMDELNDIDASLFWYAHFRNDRQTTMRSFVEAYQAYLTTTFLFRKVQQSHLLTLLKHTLIEELSVTDNSDLNLLNLSVSISSFATFLRRYGPLKDTIRKAAALTLPDDGKAVMWFQKALPRDRAELILNSYWDRAHSVGINAQQLIIVRYSADARFHFVISTISPYTNTEVHYTVQNNPLGYEISGDDKHVYFPTMLDCAQCVIDKLFLKPSGNFEITLPRWSIVKWDSIIRDAITPLPQNHYPTAKDLDKAARAIECELTASSLIINNADSSFAGVFSVQDDDDEQPQLSSTLETNSSNEQIAIGLYMVNHGLSILQSSKEIDDATIATIQRLLRKRKDKDNSDY